MNTFSQQIDEALKKQEPININTAPYLAEGIAYSTSAMATQFTNGKPLREGFRHDLAIKIFSASKNGALQAKDILIIARNYNYEMWLEYEENTNNLDTTLKSFLSLEVAEAIKDCGHFDTAGLHEKLLVSTQILYGNKK